MLDRRPSRGPRVAIPVPAAFALAAACALSSPARGQDPRALAPPAAAGATVDGGARQTYAAGALRIERPWARATPGGAKVGGGYMRIVNLGTAPDRLVGGSVAVAGRFEVHETAVADGIMRMRPVTGLEIPAGAVVELKPGGSHAMFLDLAAPLKEGDRIAGTLVFEKAGPVPVEYVVRGIGAGAGGHGH